MAKRKTHYGNARMYSMLLTNVTRSASYEALPNHRLRPAKSGLTSRLPLSSHQRSTLEKRTCLRVVDTRRFALQSGRGEIFRSLSTIIRSISTTTFALIDRTPLVTNQVHSGRKVQLDSCLPSRAVTLKVWWPRIAGVLATTERLQKSSTAKGPRGAGAEFEKMQRWSLSVISQRMKSVTHL